MSFLKRLFKTLLVLLILAVFSLALWQNRSWIMEKSQPVLAGIQTWASQGTWHAGETFPASATPPTTTETAPEPVKTAKTPVSAAHPDATAATGHDDSTAPNQKPLPANDVSEAPADEQRVARHDTPESKTAPPVSAAETVDNNGQHDMPETDAGMQLISQVRQQVWQGELKAARQTLIAAIRQEPENPAFVWELLQLEQFTQHFHQAARLQLRLQLLALKQQQEQQLQAMKQWQKQLGEQQSRLQSQILQMEQELARTREELEQPLEVQP